MKLRKIFFSLIVLAIIFGLSTNYYTSNADNTKVLYVGIRKDRNDSDQGPTIYKINEGSLYVWDLVSYVNIKSTANTLNNTLYCVNAGVGFYNTSSNEPSIKAYNKSFDLKTEKEQIANLTTNEYNSIATNQYYNSIMWLIDNMYIPNSQSSQIEKDLLLNKSGIINQSTYIENVYKLNDDDIEVVQQLALWYFTNNNDENGWNISNSESFANALKIFDSSEIELKNIDEYTARVSQMELLYNYLVQEAQNNQEYNLLNNQPLQITSTEEITTVNNNYVIGPFTIESKINIPYTNIEISVSGYEKEEISYQNVEGQIIESINNLEALEQFYIVVPMHEEKLTEINVNININYSTTQTTYWIAENATSNSTEQPLIELEKLEQEYNLEFDFYPQGDFDLSLKQFVTAISKDEGNTWEYLTSTGELSTEYTRAPKVSDVNESGIVFDENNKNPVVVEQGDYVLYTIRVYNEGDIEGYAELISNRLPEGLEYVIENEINSNYLWYYNAGDISTIYTDYLSKEQGELYSRDNLLQPFDFGLLGTNTEEQNIYYRDVQVVCKVTESNSSNRILVNYTQLENYVDKNGNAINDLDSTLEQWTYSDTQDIERLKLN